MSFERGARRGPVATNWAFYNAQWMELAAELLFRNDRLREEENYNIQNAVAEGLKLAWEMGARGEEPPQPKYQPTKYTPPPHDPEVEKIYHELRMLAWSPKSGQPPPEGYIGYKLRQRVKAPEPTPPIKPTIRRRK